MHIYGFLANTVTVIFGTGIGFFAGTRLPEKIKRIIFMGLGLSTIAIGAQMALGTKNLFLVVGSTVVGGIIGQILGIEEWLESIGEKLKKTVGASSSTFVLGFVTASLLFCTGGGNCPDRVTWNRRNFFRINRSHCARGLDRHGRGNGEFHFRNRAQ